MPASLVVSGSNLRLQGRSIGIGPLEPMPLQVDGDHVGEGSLQARVLPAALQVLAP
jgi:diacylglycerol kinase family enzyme